MTLNLHSILLIASFAMFIVAFRPSEAHSRKLKSTDKAYKFTLDDARKHLERFGYMVAVEHPNGANGDSTTTESSLESAIRTYQKKNHLEVTGKLDSETMARMMTPRCGIPDIVHRRSNAGVHNQSNPNKFHVVAHYNYFDKMNPWTKRLLTYSFTSTISSVPLEDLRAICARAFQRWAAVSPFQFQEAGDGEEGDIKIGFYFGNHGDGVNNAFTGPGGTWAHAFAPQDGRLHYDGSEQWSTSTPTMDQTDLESITVHEIGHTLGLEHSDDEDAVMYPYISRGEVKRELQQDDINGIQALYPSK